VRLLKRILLLLRDFCKGALYPGLSLGCMLLMAALLSYLRPLDYLSDSALFPQNPYRPEAQLAMRLLKWGAGLALGCGLLIWAIFKIEAWLRGRPKKGPA
jgi:hypothetical protein